MTQLFLASTAFQIVGLAAAIDSGAFDEPALPAAALRPSDRREQTAEERPERVLIVSEHAQLLEFAAPLVEAPGIAAALSRFDRVVSLNEALAPHHPTAWRPADTDLPLLEAHLRRVWGLGTGEVELIVESPQVNPAIALCRVFGDALIRVHSDGLMSYGPTRSKIPLVNGQRMTALHYLPLVEGLSPLLVSEYGVDLRPIPAESFTALIAEIADSLDEELRAALPSPSEKRTALAFGQYLSALGLITPDAEAALHEDFLTAAAEAGCDRVVFKAHPSTAPEQLHSLTAAAERLDIELVVLHTPLIAEVVVGLLRPELVVGSFSTALVTSRALYGCETKILGTAELLDTIAPYENSNRIPLTIVHWLSSRPTGSDVEAPRLQALVEAVAYCMQSEILTHLRPHAVAYLSGPEGPAHAGYFKRRRLTALRLPGALPASRRPGNVLRRAARAADLVRRSPVAPALRGVLSR